MPQILHLTLTAATVSEVTMYAPNGLEVTNRDGTAEVFVSLNGVDPVVNGPDTYCIPAIIGRFAWSAAEINTEDGSVDSQSPGVLLPIRLISTGTPKVSIRAW